MIKRRRATRSRAASTVLLAALLTTAATTGATFAAFVKVTSNPANALAAGTVVLTDNDGGSSMLSLTSALPGATDTSCIRTTYAGALNATTRGYATVTGALAPFLSLKVTRGTGATGFDNCTGFTADATDYLGLGTGVVYDGRLSAYPATYGAGVVDRASSVGTSDYASTVLATTGLQGYWRLDPGLISVDPYDDYAGKTLQDHTGSLGATWTRLIGNDAVFTDADRIRRGPVSGTSVYYSSGVPPSADYSVEADVHMKTSIGSDFFGIAGRIDPTNTNGTFYSVRYASGSQWQLYRFVNGASTLLGVYTVAFTAGQTRHVRLDMIGSAISAYVDGVQRISVTDASPIVAAGRAGIRMLGGVGSNTTSVHLDNFRAMYATTTASDSVGTNHGSFVNGVAFNVPSAVSGDISTAAQFDGVNDYVTVARQIQDDFSIEYWFKSSQGLNTSATWSANAGMVDADDAAGGNDFGTSLRSDGKITAGVDSGGATSIVSAAGGYNNGAWHQVVFTRTGATGALKLYVDGLLSGSATGGTGSLTAPANVNFGRVQGGTNYYAGALDDVAIYTTALGASDVSNHYAARFSPETWSTSEAHDYKFQVTLDNDPAIEGLSGAATFFWQARNR